ncbi:uncharacterized protein LOC126882912 [Diabrotica virgifera virgifera]|uniref:RNA-binding protein Musashi homolog Rbp6-like n=1 Tax=Diabrotica virgifera virgifera TaxID=50390 RepID=A0ABM5K181_DIAVI|nr:uncharacterized protein LOC126882912 [Diabrotica virgifera virgifera]
MEPQNQDIVVAGSPAEVPNDPGKMFIGGLSWQTSPGKPAKLCLTAIHTLFTKINCGTHTHLIPYLFLTFNYQFSATKHKIQHHLRQNTQQQKLSTLSAVSK